MKTRDDFFNLPLGLVRCLAQHLHVIVVRQVRRKHPNGTEMDAAVLEQPKNDREPARGPRGFDAVVRGVFGQMKDLRAVREHRGASLAEIQPACIELGKRRDERRCRVLL